MAVSIFLLYACNRGKTYSNETTSANAGIEPGKVIDNTRNKKLTTEPYKMPAVAEMKAAATFAHDAANAGIMEVEAAKIARKNSSNADIKTFAKLIEEDHIRSNNELKRICSKKNITIPVALIGEEKSHMIAMKNMKGKDLDIHYIDMMVADHQKAIDEFTKASKNLADPELKAFATRTLPTLQKHLNKAKELQGEL